jgi:hypothetical protein
VSFGAKISEFKKRVKENSFAVGSGGIIQVCQWIESNGQKNKG